MAVIVRIFWVWIETGTQWQARPAASPAALVVAVQLLPGVVRVEVLHPGARTWESPLLSMHLIQPSIQLSI